MGVSQKLDALFHGNSQSKMEDEQGYPYDLGNLQVFVTLEYIPVDSMDWLGKFTGNLSIFDGKIPPIGPIR